MNVNSQMKSWFKTGANLNATIIKSNQSDAGSDNNSAFVNPFLFSRYMGPIYPVYAFDPANPGQFLTLPDGSRRYDYGNLNALGLPNRPQYGGTPRDCGNGEKPKFLPSQRCWRSGIRPRFRS